MIGITINNEALDLYEKTSIRIEESNPMFDFESIPGGIVYPFKIPHTERNLRILNYPDTILNVAIDAPFEAVLMLGGLQYKIGLLRLDQVTAEESSAYFSSDAGNFKNSIEQKTLRDIDLGEIEVGTTEATLQTYMNQTVISNWTSEPVVFFPFRNETFVTEDSYTIFPGPSAPLYAISPTCPILNYYYDGSFEEWWAQFENIYSMSVKTNNAVPAVYFSHILQRICDLADFTFEGIFKDDTELSTLVMQSLNLIQRNGYPGYSDFEAVNSFVPDIDISAFLIEVRRLFCLSFEFPGIDKRLKLVSIKDILSSNEKEDWTAIAAANFKLDRRDAEDYRFEWTIDSKDDAIAADANIDASFKIHGTVSDFASLPVSPSPNDVYLVVQEWRYYTWNGTTWIFFTHPLQPLGSKAANKSVRSAFSPIAMEFAEDTIPTDFIWNMIPPARSWKIPYMSQSGSYTFAKRIQSEMKPRLLFYRGMSTDSLGNAYPFANADTTDGNGATVGNYALAWDGDNGIYQTWWKSYVTMMRNTRRVTKYIDLDWERLVGLDLHKKKRINGVDYFINKLSTTVTMKGISAATVELYKA